MEPTKEELLARIAELEAQGGSRKRGSIEFRVGEKGGVSVYGLGRFPVTLYQRFGIGKVEGPRAQNPGILLDARRESAVGEGLPSAWLVQYLPMDQWQGCFNQPTR